MLLSNPYILDYFSIGRGYGISAFFIFLSAYFFLNSDDDKYFMPIIFLSLATLSYHTTVILLINFWILNIKKIYIKFNKVNFISLNFFVIGIIFINTYILYNITSPGKPLYGINNLTLQDLLTGSFGFTSLYINTNIYFSIFINFLFILPILNFKKLTSDYKTLFYISYLSILSIYAIPLIFERPFPLLRTIFPFFIPIILLIFESINLQFRNLNKIAVIIFSTIIISTLTINLVLQIDLYETIDWKDDISKKNSLLKEPLSGEYKIPFNEIGPVGEYYRLLVEIENTND